MPSTDPEDGEREQLLSHKPQTTHWLLQEPDLCSHHFPKSQTKPEVLCGGNQQSREQSNLYWNPREQKWALCSFCTQWPQRRIQNQHVFPASMAFAGLSSRGVPMCIGGLAPGGPSRLRRMKHPLGAGLPQFPVYPPPLSDS